jgi:hypothetical protein
MNTRNASKLIMRCWLKKLSLLHYEWKKASEEFDYLKTLFDIAYYVTRNSKAFPDLERLLQLTVKLGG